ncbi:FAD-binding protein [uncultured Lentibacter sp.]|uniref:FAD-binding protein n=1 Tax=uncultured Lentibacter sp. TaxID=1659309 RepID=UPI002637291A|nr:FAD-binding protein [uncultured Lentibacter sp.]MCW1954896.1 FAD-binding protein [Roseobacter sp.]
MIFTPKTEAELAEIVAGLSAPVRLQGGGTRAVGHSVAQDVLDMSGIRGVVDYEPGALTLVAKAGTPVAEIEALLATEKQRLSFEPMDHRVLLGTQGTPTIGGVVAANVSGPRRISVGACRDFALGVRFVDGMGRAVKNGGRVMKNVTGYDLVKLMAGSWGTLGAMSEVSLKVMPCPETEATLAVSVTDAAAAIGAMSAALGSAYEVTGAAQNGPVYVRIEGFAPSVAYRLDALEALLARFGAVERLDAEASGALWQGLRDVRAFAASAFVTRVSLRPTDMPAFLAAARAGHSFEAQLDWGGGLAWLASDKESLADFAQSYCTAHGGHATRIKGSFEACAFQPEAAGVARLSRGLRQRFDPKGLFNPELMARG